MQPNNRSDGLGQDHPAPLPHQISTYSSLTGAVGPNYRGPQVITKKKVPATQALTFAPPPRSIPPRQPRQIRYIEEFVPAPHFVERTTSNSSRRRQTYATIGFDQRTAANLLLDVSGVPLADCIAGRGDSMMNPTERVFADVARGGAQSVTFAITWPGYGDLLRWERTLGLYGANGLLTRQELAFIVGKHYEEFIGYCQNLPCKEPKWQIGRNSGYNLSRMKLSSLWHLEGEVWQASIRVLSEA